MLLIWHSPCYIARLDPCYPSELVKPHYALPISLDYPCLFMFKIPKICAYHSNIRKISNIRNHAF